MVNIIFQNSDYSCMTIAGLRGHIYFLKTIQAQTHQIFSVKSPLGLVLYCYLNMPTINKAYLILS